MSNKSDPLTALRYMAEGYDNHFNAGTPLMAEHVAAVADAIAELEAGLARWRILFGDVPPAEPIVPLIERLRQAESEAARLRRDRQEIIDVLRVSADDPNMGFTILAPDGNVLTGRVVDGRFCECSGKKP